MKLMVLGIGNVLMNDDGAGIDAVNRLAQEFPKNDDLLIMDGGTLGLDLLGYIEQTDNLIIADAVEFGFEPGTVVRLEGSDIDPVFENKLSAHQMGMKDILTTAELMGIRPKNVTLFGIQSDNTECDMELSPKVAANMDKFIGHIRDEIKTYI